MNPVYARSVSNWPEHRAVATLEIIGNRPKHMPYLRLEVRGEDVNNVPGASIYSVESPATLRRLALGILEALGDE